MPSTLIAIDKLTERQRKGLWLGERKEVRSSAEAARFLKAVGFALRYNATKGLPLASLYRAVWGGSLEESEADSQRRAIEITNELLSSRNAVEVKVIADRLVLVHKSLAPSLYAIVRRNKPVEDLDDLSIDARRAYTLIRQQGHATVGDVRRLLGVVGQPREDPAHIAVSELQEQMLVCRGASDVPEHGIPYLSKEGYPYFLFHVLHADVVKAASALKLETAASRLLETYLRAAVFIPTRKLASIFKLCMNENEIRLALAGLARKKKLSIQKIGRDELVITS